MHIIANFLDKYREIQLNFPTLFRDFHRDKLFCLLFAESVASTQKPCHFANSMAYTSHTNTLFICSTKQIANETHLMFNNCIPTTNSELIKLLCARRRTERLGNRVSRMKMREFYSVYFQINEL